MRSATFFTSAGYLSEILFFFRFSLTIQRTSRSSVEAASRSRAKPASGALRDKHAESVAEALAQDAELLAAPDLAAHAGKRPA